MRAWGVALAALLAGLVIAVASPALGSKTAHLKIRLPAQNHVKVSVVTVKVTAPKGKHVGKLKVVATNAKGLGSAQTNTQVVAAISPKSSKKRQAIFKVWVFIHRYSPVPAANRTGTAGGENFVDLIFTHDFPLQITQFADSQSCHDLAHEKGPVVVKGQPPIVHNFLTDGFAQLTTLENLIVYFDSPTEEQLDNAVFSKPCPGAEDPAHDPPPY